MHIGVHQRRILGALSQRIYAVVAFYLKGSFDNSVCMFSVRSLWTCISLCIGYFNLFSVSQSLQGEDFRCIRENLLRTIVRTEGNGDILVSIFFYYQFCGIFTSYHRREGAYARIDLNAFQYLIVLTLDSKI